VDSSLGIVYGSCQSLLVAFINVLDSSCQFSKTRVPGSNSQPKHWVFVVRFLTRTLNHLELDLDLNPEHLTPSPNPNFKHDPYFFLNFLTELWLWKLKMIMHKTSFEIYFFSFQFNFLFWNKKMKITKFSCLF
jgi:hypothetical protein